MGGYIFADLNEQGECKHETVGEITFDDNADEDYLAQLAHTRTRAAYRFANAVREFARESNLSHRYELRFREIPDRGFPEEHRPFSMRVREVDSHGIHLDMTMDLQRPFPDNPVNMERSDFAEGYGSSDEHDQTNDGPIQGMLRRSRIRTPPAPTTRYPPGSRVHTDESGEVADENS